MQQESKVTVEVDNIYVMSYLLSKGYTVVDKTTRQGRVSVKFEGYKVSDMISDYYSGGEVAAKDFVTAYQQAREIVFDRDQNKPQRRN